MSSEPQSPDRSVEDLIAWREEILELLFDMRTDLTAFRDRARAGEGEGAKDAAKQLVEIRIWLKAAYETEKYIAEIKKHQDGVAGTYGCDLERARFEVGCRLARLRRCCQAEHIPE